MAGHIPPPTPIPTAALADALVRLAGPIRAAPSRIRRLHPGPPIVGLACPVRHVGSVDVFFEAIGRAQPGSVLVVDNGGREDEGCLGDLAALELAGAGFVGAVIWGRHRDSRELAGIPLAVFSLGACAAGPVRPRRRPADPFDRARMGDQLVTADDVVVADDDGILFVGLALWPRVEAVAREIVATERSQADLARSGRSLRDQYGFAEYLERRRRDPTITFRRHLRERGAAIEE